MYHLSIVACNCSGFAAVGQASRRYRLILAATGHCQTVAIAAWHAARSKCKQVSLCLLMQEAEHRLVYIASPYWRLRAYHKTIISLSPAVCKQTGIEMFSVGKKKCWLIAAASAVLAVCSMLLFFPSTIKCAWFFVTTQNAGWLFSWNGHHRDEDGQRNEENGKSSSHIQRYNNFSATSSYCLTPLQVFLELLHINQFIMNTNGDLATNYFCMHLFIVATECCQSMYCTNIHDQIVSDIFADNGKHYWLLVHNR